MIELGAWEDAIGVIRVLLGIGLAVGFITALINARQS